MSDCPTCGQPGHRTLTNVSQRLAIPETPTVLVGRFVTFEPCGHVIEIPLQGVQARQAEWASEVAAEAVNEALKDWRP